MQHQESIHVRVPAALAREIDAIAAQRRTLAGPSTRSEVVRDAILRLVRSERRATARGG